MPLVKSITSDTLIFELEDSDIEEGNANYDRLSDNDRINGAYLNKDPIAIALRKIGKYRTVFVGWLTISAWKGPKRHDYQIINDEAVSHFIRNFENRRRIERPVVVELFFQGETDTSHAHSTKKIPRQYEVDKKAFDRQGKVVM